MYQNICYSILNFGIGSLDTVTITVSSKEIQKEISSIEVKLSRYKLILIAYKEMPSNLKWEFIQIEEKSPNFKWNHKNTIALNRETSASYMFQCSTFKVKSVEYFDFNGSHNFDR